MSNYVVAVEWKLSTEIFVFDLDSPLVEGGEVSTARRQSDTRLCSTRSMVVQSVVHVAPKWIMQLTTRASFGGDMSQASEPWGVATLTIDVEALTASAIWQSDPPRRDIDGAAPATVRPESLFEELGAIWARRRDLREAEFKRELAALDGCACALSGKAPFPALEAARVDGSRGGFDVDNAALMRADLRRLFDEGAMSISNAGFATFAASVGERYGRELSGKPLNAKALSRVADALRARNARSVEDLGDWLSDGDGSVSY